MTSRACSARRPLAAAKPVRAAPPPSLATGKGDHAKHGGGGDPTRRRSALPLHRLSAVPLPRRADEESGLLRAASLHGSRRAYAILPGRSRRGRGTMRSMVEGASTRRARALPPPPPIGGPPPSAHAGEESGLATGRLAPPRSSPVACDGEGGPWRTGGGNPRAGARPCPLHRLSAVPLPRLTRVRIRARDGPPRSTAILPVARDGEGDHAKHGGGGDPTRRRSALAPSTAYRRSPSPLRG